MDQHDKEQTRLPDDFDIDLPIEILSDIIVLKHVPFSQCPILLFDNEIEK